MFRRTSVAVIIALFMVISISGLYYERSVYRYDDGRPREDYIDNFVDDSLGAGNNFIGGISSTMQTMQDIFGFVGGLPVIKDLVSRDEKDWSKVEIYEIDYRKERNRYKTDLDVLPPEEFVEVGDELIVKIICADYDVLDTYNVYRVFYRVWTYGNNGYYTDYKCYMGAIYKRDGFLGKTIRKVKRGNYLGIHPLGYVTSEQLDWVN